MADINEIRRSLCSDKITIRKKGKTDCETLLSRDKTIFASNHVQTMEFMRALMEYEVKEIDAGQIKGKKINPDASSFVKKMVKYCLSNGQVVSTKVTIVLEHILNILYDDTLPPSYKNEHRILLCDILEPRNTHSIPFDKKDRQLHVGLNKLFLYLRDVMIDSRSTSDSNNLKLLRLLCRSMFSDGSNHPESVLKYLMQWFNELIKKAVEMAATHPQLSACLADCCRYFVEFQGANLALTIFGTVEVLLQLVIKQLCTHQFRDTHRHAYIKFLLRLMDISSVFNWKHVAVLPTVNPLCRHIAGLSEVVCSDESLRALMLFANSTLQTQTGGGNSLASRQHYQNRDACPCLLDDLKVSLNYELIARASYHHQALRSFGDLSDTMLSSSAATGSFLRGTENLHEFITNNVIGSSSSSSSGNNNSSSSSSSSNNHINNNISRSFQRPEEFSPSSSTQQHPSKRLRTHLTDESCSVFTVDSIWTRLKQPRGTLTSTGGVRGGITQTQVSGFAGNIGTQLKTQGGATQSGLPSGGSRQGGVQLHDSLVLVAISLFRQFPQLDFLAVQSLPAQVLRDTAIDCRGSPANYSLLLDKLGEWVELFRVKLAECLQLSGAVDFSHCGLLLMALTELARVTHLLLLQYDVTAALRGTWFGVASLLLESRALVRLASSAVCRRHSVTDRQLSLLRCINEFSLLESTSMGKCRRLMWSTGSVTDPSLVDSPEVFRLLWSLTRASHENVPLELCSSFLVAFKERCCDEVYDPDSLAAVGGMVDQHVGALVSLIESAKKVPVVQFVSLWLMDGVQSLMGRDVVVSSRFAVTHTHSFNVAIGELLLTHLTHDSCPPPHVSSDIVTASKSLRDRSALHWLDPPLSLAGDIFTVEKSANASRVSYSKSSDMHALNDDCAHSLSLLDCVRDKLLSMRVFVATTGGSLLSSGRRSNEEFNCNMFAVSGDGASGAEGLVTPWQLTGVMLLSAYATIANSLGASSSPSPADLLSLQTTNCCVESFLQLLHTSLVYLQNKVLLIKPALLAEYLCELSYVIQCLATAVGGVFSATTENKRRQCCDLFHSILRSLQKESTNNKHGGIGGGEALDDPDFDRDERAGLPVSSQTSQKTSSSTSRARKTSTDTFAAEHEDDEDFMDGPVVSATPSSHVRSSVTARGGRAGVSSRVMEVDSDIEGDLDDGFVAARRGGDQGATRGFSGKMHAVFSTEYLRALVAVMQSILIMTTVRSAGMVSASANKIVTYLSVMEGSGHGAQATRLVTPSEVYLTIAQQLSLLQPSQLVVATIRALVDRCPWHIEWGPLGYCQVLGVIQQVTAQEEFWKEHRVSTTAGAGDEGDAPDDPDDLVVYLFRLVLPQDDKALEPFPAAQFQIRVLQLECVANLMQHGGEDRVAEIKQSITALFVNAVADRDMRVRLLAARKLPLLLTHFKKPDKVYTALVSATLVPILFVSTNGSRLRGAVRPTAASDDEPLSSASVAVDPLLTLTTAISIARMGCCQVAASVVNIAITRKALLDLMVLCCSRHKHLQPLNLLKLTSVSGGSGATQQSSRLTQSVASSADDSFALLRGCMDYRDVLFRLVAFMAHSLGYSNSGQLLSEYMRWLLYQWLVMGDVTGSDKNVDEDVADVDTSPLSLSLADFPYQLFLTTEQKTHGEHGFNFAQFLSSQSETILPLLAAISNHRLRWNLLQQFTTDCGQQTSDRGMVQVVRQNISSIKALEFSVFFAGMSRQVQGEETEHPLYTEAMKTVQALQQFVSRNLNTIELNQIVSTKISDTIQALFLLQTFERAAPCESPLHEEVGEAGVTVDAVERFLFTVLTKICDMVEVNRIALLLAKCNVLELLAALRNRLVQTRLVSVCRTVLAAVRLMTQHIPVLSSACFNAILGIVKVSIDCYPGELVSSVTVLRELVISVCRKNATDDTKNRGPVNAPHLFAEVVVLISAVTLAIKRCSRLTSVLVSRSSTSASISSSNSNVGGRLKRTRAVAEDDHLFDEEEDGDSDDLLVDRADREMKSDREPSTTDIFISAYYASLSSSANLLPSLETTKQSLLESVVRLWSFLKSESCESILTACLPIPAQYAVHFESDEIREELSSDLWRMVSLKERAISFVAMTRRVLNGEVFPLSVLWIELLNFRDVLEGRVAALAVTASLTQGLWKTEPGLSATCVSSLLGLCEHRFTINHNNISESHPIDNVMRETCLHLLGHIGPPDLFSLSHGADFPSHIGDIARDCEFSVPQMKLSLVQRIFSLLSADGGEGYHQASQCLRVLSTTGYFSGTDRVLVGKLAENTHLGEIVDAYRISVQPKHRAVRMGAGRSVDEEIEEVFGDAVWRVEVGGARPYEEWVTRVTHRLVTALYVSDEVVEGVAKKQNALVTKSSDGFLRACADVCLLRVDIAETIFQLVVTDLLTVNGAQSYLCDKLSQCIRLHMLSPQCAIQRVTQLGCQTLILLLRQDIAHFVDRSQKKQVPTLNVDGINHAIVIKVKRVEPSKMNDDCDWSLPFSYYLNIDCHYAAAAATRCQSVCSALLFAELGAERSRHSLVRVATKITSTITTGSSSSSSNSGAVVPVKSSLRPSGDKSALTALLIPIFRGLHDPDALHGVADMSADGTNLSLQAAMYEHEGRWMEALSTYETIIQSRVGGRIQDSGAEVGVLRSLEGLGAQYTLSNMGGGITHDTSRATEGGGLCRADSASTALQTWSSTLQVGANSRDDALSVCIASAVRDLTQKNCSSALQRVAASTRVLLTDMASRSGEECAHNIVNDLAQAQQLREIVEVCGVLGENSGSAPLSAEDLLRRWHARDGNVSGHVQQQDLRFTLLSHLLRRDALSAPQAVDCMTAILSRVKSRDTAHSVSPLVYRYWNLISDHVTKGRTAGRTSDTLSLATNTQLKVLHAQWALYECKLLWRKGLKEVAVSNVTNKVVTVLRDLLPPTSDLNGNNSSSSSSSSAVKVFGGRNSASNRSAVLAKDDTRMRNLLSEALRMGGEWMSTKRAATATEILVDYLEPAVSYAKGVSEKISAHETLGGFNSRLHQNVKNKLASPEWKQGARVLADRAAEFEQCRLLQNSERQNRENKTAPPTVDPKALYRHTLVLKKEVEQDTRERQAVEASANKYLLAALHDYGQVLSLSTDDRLDAVFRVVNLWLSNSENAQVNNLVDDMMERVASYKFVPLTYQVFSRLGKPTGDELNLAFGDHDQEALHAVVRRSSTNKSAPGSANKLQKGASQSSSIIPLPKTNNDLFQFVLTRLVFKLCAEHPHHTLAQLFALANEREMGGDGAAQYKVNNSSSRCEAANAIVEQLLKHKGVGELVSATQALLLAYIELAKTSTEVFQKQNKIRDIKFKEMQSRGKRFNECLSAFPTDTVHRPAVITEPLKLNPLMEYQGAPRTVEFQPTFSITENGISRPKIISCLGSDGHWHKQLVKGGDDMRQDAVMEQVFEAVNHMLVRDDEAAKRVLGIRTYKIIPTTPQTGVLQWVENTLPFGSILYDKETGTHNRYYSSDTTRNAVNDAEWTHMQCREHLKDADNADKLRKFEEVMDHFHPSLRFFFLERYADPAKWTACRLAYIRSVAVTSMVGYILGIGDRHAHNILVDTLTAEVVHIDFGIVYEQGKGLGAPETVPFRLTRDIVDGMGVTGVEGTFRRSCEEVLRVLRDNALQIMTILEVVIHDPLYKWSLSPLQARMKQNAGPDFQLNMSTKSTSLQPQQAPQTAGGLQGTIAKQGGTFGKDAAERTLSRIKNKLQGHEDPTGEALSVEGLVDLLINEARSPNNLCRLFPGWAPWL